MSQQEIDRFMHYLQENPEEMKKARAMAIDDLVGFAEALGFRFEQEDLEARQALIHMFEGT